MAGAMSPADAESLRGLVAGVSEAVEARIRGEESAGEQVRRATQALQIAGMGAPAYWLSQLLQVRSPPWTLHNPVQGISDIRKPPAFEECLHIHGPGNEAATARQRTGNEVYSCRGHGKADWIRCAFDQSNHAYPDQCRSVRGGWAQYV